MFKKIVFAAFLVLVIVSTSQANPLEKATEMWVQYPPGYGAVLSKDYTLLTVQNPTNRASFFALTPREIFFKELEYVSFQVDENKPEFFKVYTYTEDSVIVSVPTKYVKQVMEGDELTIKHGDRKFTFPLKNADDILYKVMTHKESDL